MSVNNHCSTLIVYGSFIPGGANHHIFAALPGIWKRGKIVCQMIEPPDGIGPSEYQEVEAWTIKFSDCVAEMFSPDYEAQERLLYERWMSLDRAMGDTWARDSARWWPAESQPAVGKNGMIVVNIFVPLQYYPYLENQDEMPSPDEEEDMWRLWRQVKTGEKRYEWSIFVALIKDSLPEHYNELFADLPKGDVFIAKLEQFFLDFRKGSGNLLWDGTSEEVSLYVVPTDLNSRSQEELLDLAKSDLIGRAALLRTLGHVEDAAAVASLRFEFSSPPECSGLVGIAATALDNLDDTLGPSDGFNERWQYCLREACYGIAASYALTDWLMSHWYPIDFDYEPAYQMWKGGGRYEVVGDTCYVYRME